MKAPITDVTQADFAAGELLLVDKPQGWTSFDVVNKLRYLLRRITGIKRIKVGHSGTLDPMATGLLQICTGKMTKQLDMLQGQDKCYTGTMLLGATTLSYDSESEVDATYPVEHITSDLLEAARQKFIGEFEQIPPMFSAIKVDGQPLYKLARRGVKKEIKARSVRIDQFDLDASHFPEIKFWVKCGKGTYIRSLAYDFGMALDSGAYLTALTRTCIGMHQLEYAWKLEDLVTALERITKEGGASN